MKLKRLILQGFKSFKDRTVIHFDEGITGIVGPNGCGKSNVVDALFWVMGEQSAKHLRGNSMKDVIFAGSSKYSPAAFAEVSLVLENDDGKHIHIGNQVASPSEIQLTRKLYRNGDTEYRINDIPSRLKDIQEVFMDTGAGAKSYSIIAQGEINRLVQSKPEERRTMIEDVAGITKFKLRKRESLKKIEATEQNLSRLKDLQLEIEKHLKALEKQAEKAEKARELKDKVKKYELITNAHKEFELLKNLKERGAALEFKQAEIEKSQLAKNQLELSLEEERFKKDEETYRLEEAQKEFNDLSKELAGLEARLKFLKQGVSEKEKNIQTREQEKIDIQSEMDNRRLKLYELNTLLSDWQKKGEEEQDFSELNERVDNLKDELQLFNDQWNDVKDDLEKKKSEALALSQEIFKNTSRLEEYSGTLQDLTKEIEAIEGQFSGVHAQMAEDRERVTLLEKEVSDLKSQEHILKTDIDQETLSLKSLESNLKEKNKSIIQTESKIVSLKEINRTLEGNSAGAKDFLEKHPEEFMLFGSMIRCGKENAKAVSLILSDYLNLVIKKGSPIDHLGLKSLNEWVDESAFNLDVLRIHNSKMSSQTSSETIARLELVLDSKVHPLMDTLELEETEKQLLNDFLEGFYIADHFTTESMLSLSRDVHFKAIVNRDGSLLVSKVHGEELQYHIAKEEAVNSQSVVERNNDIIELESLLSTLHSECTNLEQEFSTMEKGLELKKIQWEELRGKIHEIQGQYVSKKSALEAKSLNFESSFSRLDILKNRKNEISKSRLNIIENEEKNFKREETLKEDIQNITERHEDLKDQVELLTAQYQEEKELLVTKLVEAKSFESTVKNYQNQIADIESQLARLTDRSDKNAELLEHLHADIDSMCTEIDELERSNFDRASALSDREDVLSLLKDQLATLLISMKEREDKVKELTAYINKTSREISEIEVSNSKDLIEEEQLTRNIFEKYQIDLRHVLGRFLDFQASDYEFLKDVQSMYTMETLEGVKDIEVQPYEFVRRYGQDLKDCDGKFKNYKMEFSRLGDVNWQAIEDYDRQKLRFEFLNTQEKELRASLEDLQKAIHHIDEKSKARFEIAFQEVTTRFSKVFPIIFGGGSAELKLVGDLNDPDCGIDIVAQPPGKKMQNINLMSGGEKAMTAVSLIFSIFLVKPSPFCLLDEVDAPLDDANVGRFNELLREMSADSQFILITHNKKTMELNDTLYGVTMQEPGVSKAVSVELH